ncbi:O-methyltransferase [Kribbella sp. NPDC051620]|uniref:O-methyltransferase n=1 Tax=Kribbella sp. NPDC051620 TaxID=3364120 RepID=UPI0037B44DE9
MDDNPRRFPEALPVLRAAALDAGFAMSCDERTGNLLTVLAAARPGGRVLELGTGAGEGTAWLLDGMDAASRLVSIELDPAVQAIPRAKFDGDPRVTFATADGGKWLEAYDGPPFDLVFADTWPGKFTHLERALQLVVRGGTYLVDDLLPQANWPEGHGDAVERLLAQLDERTDFHTVRLTWSTGLLLAVRSA